MPSSLNLFLTNPVIAVTVVVLYDLYSGRFASQSTELSFTRKKKCDPTPGESGSLLSTVCYESFPNEECISTVLFYALFYSFTQEEIIGCIFNVLSRELEDLRLSLKLIEKFWPCVLQSLSQRRYIRPW